MRNTPIRVLIAGVGGGGFGLEILKALRHSEIAYYICGCDMVKYNLGFSKSDKKYTLPPAIDPLYIEKLLSICQNEKIDVLFPGSEPDLWAISENRDVLQDQGIFLPINDARIIKLCLNKKETFQYLDTCGIAIPRTVPIETKRDIQSIDFFPSVIKPYLGGGGSNNTFIAQDAEELNFFCNYILKYGGKPLVQEYVGSYENEYTVGVLSGRDKEIVSVIGIRRFIMSGLSNRIKIRSLRKKDEILAISSGISQGQIVNDDNLNKQCIEIAKKLGSTGPINVQCRYVDGVAYPFEINPRFSGTTYLRALGGVNEPDLFIRKYFIDEDIHSMPQPKEGMVLRGLEEIMINELD
ncbi:MAG: ATP-grasp domain-containing protein [Methanoregula sp.]|nr:ATP-grasp domain-containing protein [Methanoregula sp.]